MGSNIRSKVALSVAGLQLASVDVVSAVASTKDFSASMVCDHAGSGDDFKDHALAKVTQKYECAVCGKLEPQAGYPLRAVFAGNVATLFTEDMKKAMEPTEEVKTRIDLRVHNSEEIKALVPSGGTYYLKPDRVNAQAYSLFRHVIASRPDLTFVAVWAPRSKASLFEVTVRDDALMMSGLAFPSDVYEPPKVDAVPDERMIGMLTTLLESSVQPFNVDDYVNQAKSIAEQAIAEATPVNAVPVDGRASKEGERTVQTLDLTASLEAAVKLATKAKPVTARTKAAKKKVSA